MLNRLRVVAASYATRWGNWGLLLLGLAIIAAGIGCASGPSFKSMIPVHRDFWKSVRLRRAYEPYEQNNVRGVRDTGDWEWSDWDVNADALYIYHGPKIPWDRIREMPQLKRLTIRHLDRPRATQLVGIEHLTTLEYLDLPTMTLTADDAKLLAPLQNLTWLNAVAVQFESGFEVLPVLPNLHTLELRLDAMNENALEYLGKLPKLETLVLQDGSNPSSGGTLHGMPRPYTPTQEQLDLIRQLGSIESLQTIYVPGREFGVLEDEAKKALPNIVVRPLSVNVNQSRGIWFVMFGGTVIGTIACMGIYGQFTRPEAVLAPHYALPHFLMSMLWLAFSVCTSTTCAWLLGAHPLSISSMAFLVLGVYFCFLRVRLPAWGRVLVIAFMLTQMLPFDSAFLLGRRFILGDLPMVIPIACTLAGLGMLAHSLNVIQRLHQDFTEEGVSFPILSLQDQGMAAQILMARSKRGSIFDLFRPSDRRFDELLHSAPELEEQPKRRLLLSLPSNPNGLRIAAYSACIGYVLILFSSHIAGYSQSAIHGYVHLIGLGYLQLLSSLVITNRWLLRRPTLGYESCRPLNRQLLTDDLFHIWLGEVIVLPVLLSIVVVAFHFLTRQVVSDALFLSAGFVFVIWANAAVLYGAISFAMSLRSDWRIVAVGLLSALLIIGASVGMVALSNVGATRLGFLNPVVMIVASVLLGGAGLGLAGASKHRWSELELGSLGVNH